MGIGLKSSARRFPLEITKSLSDRKGSEALKSAAEKDVETSPLNSLRII